MVDVTPANALDSHVMLATGVHAQPGVYALLLGSGVSTGAGIPTGWGVVRDLVRRAAAAKEPEDPQAAQHAYDDPEGWWEAHGDGNPLGYSNLLGALASTPAARRALLTRFFEPSDEDAEAGLKVPSPAHRAIAALARRGTVRVVLTTNFDRLTERAMEDAGVSPQVISNVGALAGMSPLQHAAATVVKLHGDYADLLQRNTVNELGGYPPEWDQLLDRVLTEYGLIISGWSADWDTALVAAIERLPVRRYPLYWDSRSAKGENARRLVAQQTGTVLPSPDADSLFTGLLERLEALDRLSEPPLTTALAVQRLKRYLPDPRRRIDLHDLVMGQLAMVVERTEALPQHLGGDFAVEAEKVVGRCEAATEPLARLVMVGIQHDTESQFADLWVECLQRLLRADHLADGTFQESIAALRRYPALLLLRATGLAALLHGRDDLFISLLTQPKWRSRFGTRDEVIAAHALDEYRVLDGDLVNALPRSGGTRWLYPPSHHLREAMRPLFADLLPGKDEYSMAQDDYEFQVALVQHVTKSAYQRAVPGEFLLAERWNGEETLLAERRFRGRADTAPDDWAWIKLIGKDDVDTVLTSLRTELVVQRQFVM